MDSHLPPILPRRSRWLLLALGAFVTLVPAHAALDLHFAEQDLLRGRADQAIAGLRSALNRDPANAGAHLLLCRTFLSEEHGPEASDECAKALKTGLAQDSAAQDWAGRAFGMRAQHAGPVAGLKLAGEVRAAFQSAFHLNPRSPAAANDLGEYYISAPFIVGGGVDKATALTETIEPALPEVAHRLRALIAEKHGDTASAEREFLAATAVAHAPGSFVDLAFFYARQGANEKAVAAARRVVQEDRSADANLVDAAVCLSESHQPALAIQVLRSYLDHGKQSDQAPAFRAHTLLGELLAAQGDPSAARAQFQQALALATGYAPARKGLDSL